MKKTERQKDKEIRPGMQVEFICPKCGNWVTNENRKKPKLDLLLPTDDDQLTLF